MENFIFCAISNESDIYNLIFVVSCNMPSLTSINKYGVFIR